MAMRTAKTRPANQIWRRLVDSGGPEPERTSELTVVTIGWEETLNIFKHSGGHPGSLSLLMPADHSKEDVRNDFLVDQSRNVQLFNLRTPKPNCPQLLRSDRVLENSSLIMETEDRATQMTFVIAERGNRVAGVGDES